MHSYLESWIFMRISKDWIDYQILSASDEYKIEKVGPYVLKRPDPLAQFSSTQAPSIDASYTEQWHLNSGVPESWTLKYKHLNFIIKPTKFKHIGIFPEQAVNWDWMQEVIESSDKPLRILNLFGYTGGATLACVHENVEEIVHVDALKSAIVWTQDNIKLNHFEDAHIRTIVDDVMKFIQREKRRGRTYHGIIMDPPSFGRGPKGERWKIETQLQPLLQACLDILDDDALFMVINTYTTNLSSKDVTQILSSELKQSNHKGYIHSDAIGLPIQNSNDVLSGGITTRWCYREDLLRR